jgi:hypothetical protein
MKFRIPTWTFGLASGLSAVAAAYIFLSAIATASLRFAYCGATTLEAPEQYCRMGTKLLYLSFALGALTLALVAVTLWLFWRRRKGSNNSFKPKPLRGSA